MKKLASIFVAGICLVMLTVAVAPALGAEADSVAGGEARRTYGVNEERSPFPTVAENSSCTDKSKIYFLLTISIFDSIL